MRISLPIDSTALLAAAAGTAESGGKSVLVATPQIFVGMKTFQPGEVFGNHFHQGYDEFFAGLEGVVTIWQGCSSRITPGRSKSRPRAHSRSFAIRFIWGGC